MLRSSLRKFDDGRRTLKEGRKNEVIVGSGKRDCSSWQ
jgi:hypothetical protein